MPSMLRNLVAVGHAGARRVDITSRRFASDVIVGVVGRLVFLLLVSWGLVFVGWHNVNWGLALVGAIGMAIWGYSPRRFFIAMGMGALVQGLRDEDLTQGAILGIVTWHKVVRSSIAAFLCCEIMLATPIFDKSPLLFIPILVILLTMLMVYVSDFGEKLKTIALVATGVALLAYSYPVGMSHWNAHNKKPAPGASEGSQGTGASGQQAGAGSAASAPEGPQYTPPRPGTPSTGSVERQMTASQVPESARATSTITTPTWNKPSEDGDLPMEVWSKSMMIDPGCGVTFDAGNCVKYVVRFRYQGGEWSEHTCAGAFPTGDEVQFKVLEPMKKVPVRLTCS